MLWIENRNLWYDNTEHRDYDMIRKLSKADEKLTKEQLKLKKDEFEDVEHSIKVWLYTVRRMTFHRTSDSSAKAVINYLRTQAWQRSGLLPYNYDLGDFEYLSLSKQVKGEQLYIHLKIDEFNDNRLHIDIGLSFYANILDKLQSHIEINQR